MDFKILDTFAHDGHLVVVVEHYNADGAHWFTENYLFPGREGHRRCIKKNLRGKYLMDDNKEVPADGLLPPGRGWARETTFNLAERHILHTITGVHQNRLVSGWPQGYVDRLPNVPSHKMQAQDRSGADILAQKFRDMPGRQA